MESQAMLDKVNLITYLRRARCFIGVFFVQKKDGSIRMVLDCRPANELHRVPPRTLLSAPGALGNLNLSESWREYVQSQLGEDEVVADWRSFDPHGAGVDLQDGFYQYLVPELSSWFCFGTVFRKRGWCYSLLRRGALTRGGSSA